MMENEGTELAETLDGGVEASEATGPDTTSGFNPAWEPIKENLS